MAKQRKMLFPSNPNSFFDEMEREVNSTKRKKCKKVNPVPPEKLFLQFDPSKKEDDCSSKKSVNSQSFLMQKTQWKPPIKRLSQPECFQSCKVIVPENNDENVCSMSNENMAKVGFSNDDNLKTIGNCLEENRSENGEYLEDNKENAKVIIINSSPESSEQNSPETVLNDNDRNKCSEHEDLNETGGEIGHSGKSPKTIIQEREETNVIDTYQEEGKAVAKECFQRSASGSNCNFEVGKHTLTSINLSTCQDLNAIMSKGESRNIGVGEISILSDKLNFSDSSHAVDEGKLRPIEDIHKEELKKIGHPNNNINTQPAQCSEEVRSQIDEVKPVKTDIANTKSDESKIINPRDVLYERKLSLKERFVMQELDTEIGQQINNKDHNQTQSCEEVRSKIDEVKPVKTEIANTKSDEFKIINPRDVLYERKLSLKEEFVMQELDTEIGQQINNKDHNQTQSCEEVRSKIYQVKPVKTEIANTKSDESKIVNPRDVLEERKLSLKEEFVMQELNTEIGQQTNSKDHNQTQCYEKVKFQIDEIPLTTDMTANTEKSDKSKIIIEKTVSEIDVCTLERSKNNSNQIQSINETAQIDTVQFESVLEDSSPKETKSSPEPEVATGRKEDKINLNVPCDVGVPVTDLTRSDVYTVEDSNNKYIPPNNNGDYYSINQNTEQGNNNTNINVCEKLERNTNSIRGDETKVIKKDEHTTKDLSIQNNDTLETNLTFNEIVEKKKGKDTNEFEQLLEVENKIQEEKLEMDEEYSCLMISNSQLAEIEKNYYESSQNTVVNEVSKCSDRANNCVQFNQLIPNENKIVHNCNNADEKFENVNLIHTQAKLGSRTSSDSFLRNIPLKLPSVQWTKNLLEMKNKLRDLNGEIQHLNSLLMGFRREIWPQNHRDNPST